jgi:hypothetical protein
LKRIKIGEPNKNCAYIPLNPTYGMRKGSETDSPFLQFTYTQTETSILQIWNKSIFTTTQLINQSTISEIWVRKLSQKQKGEQGDDETKRIHYFYRAVAGSPGVFCG